MNRIFSPFGEGWPGFPSRAYGRLDQTEPLDLSNAPEALFAFDAVDADWPGFGPGGGLDLGQPAARQADLRRYWRGGLAPVPSLPAADPYDAVPIYRIEITARRGDAFFDQLMRVRETDWITLELAAIGAYAVEVFGGLFAAPVRAYLQALSPTPALQGASLSAIFDMEAWPDAAAADIQAALGGLPEIAYLVAFDIGQGSAVGLADVGETVRAYFDLGCGVYGNARTRPNPLRFCWRGDPPIVMSHWDTDHWAGETCDPAAQGRTWIAPRQTIGPTHVAFADRILRAGGRMLIWGAGPPTITAPVHKGALILARCAGSSRNGSGVAGVLENWAAGESWLLTGDAGYHEIPLLPGSPAAPITAVVVPHHGADMGPRSRGRVPPAPGAAYRRLLYSFGPGNRHGSTKVSHPTAAALADHQAAGWRHGAWTPSTVGVVVPGADVLATACNGATHLDGAAAAWGRAAVVPFTTVPCSGTQCTLAVVQG